MKKERENMTVELMKVNDYYGDNDHETTRIGFDHEDFFITEPFTDETGRFDVNPLKYYGLTQHQLYELDKFNQQDPAYLAYTG